MHQGTMPLTLTVRPLTGTHLHRPAEGRYSDRGFDEPLATQPTRDRAPVQREQEAEQAVEDGACAGAGDIWRAAPLPGPAPSGAEAAADDALTEPRAPCFSRTRM